jgi:hypothetical protein
VSLAAERSTIAPISWAASTKARLWRLIAVSGCSAPSCFPKVGCAKISRVEVFQVDLVPKLLSDATQAFSKQETPMVRIWTDDGEDGTLSSVVYRRWLKEKGLRYGTAEGGWQTPAGVA